MLQLGFGFIEVGSVHEKNRANSFIKNMIVPTITIILYFFIGYGIANEADGGVIGYSKFAGKNFDHDDYYKFVL
jgi:ammonia channel protein AmtB